ncbi:MAG TPA: YciI family protein [Steroidobacteraceae bacterium]|jgi:hypothetical protein
MLYAILIHGSESHVAQWPAEEENEVMARHATLRGDLTESGRLGPVMRLSPEGTRIVRKYKDRRFVTDGPFAETKEQLMGLYVVDCPTFEDALAAVDRLDFDTGVFEIRPAVYLHPGVLPPFTPPPTEE